MAHKEALEHDTENRTGRLPFCVAKTDNGEPLIQLKLFHYTVPRLTSLTVGFKVLSGVTLEQARLLVGAMSEKIIGVIATPK